MHPALSLVEAHSTGGPQLNGSRLGKRSLAPSASTTSPRRTSSNDDYHGNGSEYRRESWSSSASARLERGPNSSGSSPAAHVTPPSTTRYIIDQFSPTHHMAQGVFSINEASDMSQARRASRRRTGPLTPEQRERAAVMRKLGACKDCRRRRVAVSLTPHPRNVTSFILLP